MGFIRRRVDIAEIHTSLFLFTLLFCVGESGHDRRYLAIFVWKIFFGLGKSKMIVFIAYDKKETPFNLKGVSFYD